MFRLRPSTLPLLTLTLAVPIRAGAEGTSDKTAAESLFQDARKLMAEHKYSAACSKLAASQRLDPAVGTLLNLADCYEKNGQTASAWSTFRETAAAARQSGSTAREQLARDRAAQLEPKLSRLTIQVPHPVSGLVLLRDGEPIDAALIGTAVAVDPGRHTVGANAPNRKTWSTTVEIPPNGAAIVTEVPLLEDDPNARAAADANRSAARPDAAPADPAGGGTQKWIGGALALVGVGGLATGAYFGVKARQQWDDARSHCPEGGACVDPGPALSRDAGASADVATAAIAVGSVAVVAGVVLWISAPAHPQRPAVGWKVTPRGLALSGAF
jgi:hypothetical protein